MSKAIRTGTRILDWTGIFYTVTSVDRKSCTVRRDDTGREFTTTAATIRQFYLWWN